jgi:hypothetical protein
MFLTVVLPLVFLLTVVPVVALLYGITRWQSETGDMRKRLEATRQRQAVRTFDPEETRDLPAPVRRYFQAVLSPGQPLIAVAELGHRGEINLDETREHWTAFCSTQVVNTERPGFHWDARIRRAPAVQVFAQDAYSAGAGSLKAALLGFLKVAEAEPSSALSQAALMRYLAEAVWYPTKLLPSQGVTWQAIDDRAASATLSDGENQVSLTFEFDESGMVRQIQAANRWRTEKSGLVEQAWEVCVWGYETRGGMRIPIHGEAAWLLPTGRLPYWRGQLTDVLYKFAA